jgi:hypothetical protein
MSISRALKEKFETFGGEDKDRIIRNSFKRWRRRVFEQGKLKNNPHTDFRFKCKSQRLDGSTKNYP